MSAKVFKDLDVKIIKKIPQRDCIDIVKNIRETIEMSVFPAGSTCHTEFSGDVDVVVQCADKEALWKKLCESFAHVRKCGAGFAVLYEQPGLGHVQIDLWPSHKAKNDAWCLAGGRLGGFKGRYRNILLGYLAKRKSIKTGHRVTFASPGGLGQPGKERTSDPQAILTQLNVPCDPDTATSVEGIVESLVAANQKELLVGFDDYLRNPKDHMPVQTEEVISYVNAFLLDN